MQILNVLTIILALIVTSNYSFVIPNVSHLSHHSTRSLSSANLLLFSKPKASGKIQVLLHKTIPGTGNHNEVVQVKPAYYQNVIQKQKLGVKVTDEEVKELQKKMKEKRDTDTKIATDLKKRIESVGTFKVSRKAGDDGRLFGSVSKKDVMKVMKDELKDEMLNKGSIGIKDKKGIKSVGVWECEWGKGKLKADFVVEVVKEG